MRSIFKIVFQSLSLTLETNIQSCAVLLNVLFDFIRFALHSGEFENFMRNESSCSIRPSVARVP